MSVVHSTARSRKPVSKPDKPYPDFPLYAHASGQWAKTFKGKKHYLGAWDDWQGALSRWRDLEAGYQRPEFNDRLTVKYLVNAMLNARKLKVISGDLTDRTFRDYKKIGQWLVNHIGDRPVESIRPSDFDRLRAAFPSHWGTVMVRHYVTTIRMYFKFASETGLIERPILFGTNFVVPSKKRRKLERKSKPKKVFTADEIHRMLRLATTQMKAMILLGLNAGYGNSDCARLTIDQVTGEWLDVPREKTGEDRRAWLWPETRRAIQAVIREREVTEGLLFITSAGQPWVTERNNSVTMMFNDLKSRGKCDRNGVGFYALRHMTETIGGESRDQVAVDYVMGHTDGSMAATYREDISDERVRAVCERIRDWYLTGSITRRAAK